MPTCVRPLSLTIAPAGPLGPAGPSFPWGPWNEKIRTDLVHVEGIQKGWLPLKQACLYLPSHRLVRLVRQDLEDQVDPAEDKKSTQVKNLLTYFPCRKFTFALTDQLKPVSVPDFYMLNNKSSLVLICSESLLTSFTFSPLWSLMPWL